MRPLRGMRAVSSDEILARREACRLYDTGGRYEGHARQSALAERNNPNYVGPDFTELARLRREIPENAERRAAKNRARRLRKAARQGDARTKVKQQQLWHSYSM